ncbi:MAG: DNA polymerase III subunit alpha [Opitutaceae bacterium]|nr:DNA polymerase III subunit alpha [Cytophagales bacterium]
MLNAHSFYSLRYGTMPLEHLIQAAAKMGHEALTLTDINNTTGSLDFVRLCRENGIKPVVGAEFRIGDEKLYYAIARNNEGFKEINELITGCNRNKQLYPEKPVLDNCYLVYPYGKRMFETLKENEFIGIGQKNLNKIAFEPRRHLYRMVMENTITHNGKEGYELHKNLLAIDRNILQTQLLPHQISGQEEHLVNPTNLRKTFGSHPELMHNTKRIIDDCSFDFDFTTVKNKKTFTGSDPEDKELLFKLTYEGLEYRYGPHHKEAKERVEKELAIIDVMGFCSYFLITWDLISYAFNKGYYTVGRGSGANSVVAYCLRITNVCPIALNLYFERFLNPKRKSPPDFDIDFSWKERDDVTEYLFKKYGQKHVALLGAMGTFQDRAPLRELGKVFGLPKGEIDNLIAHPNAAINQTKLSKELHAFREFMQDFPNNRTIHAGGILVSEEPISCYTACDFPPKGFLTTQFDMHTAEAIGFEKLDVLSQRGIAHIKDAVNLVKTNKGVELDVHNFPMLMQDEGIKRSIKTAKTIGAFYVESPYMRGLFHKLRCEEFLTLVAASSIIRPGVSKSKMMGTYVYRYNNPDSFTYLHPVMKEQLEETFGVMIYQEDVLKIGHHFGGLDLAEADVLRRTISGKKRSIKHLEEIRDKYFSNCKARGYEDSVTNEVWRQIESFAGFSFCKAHSASYAVQSYQSLYLKAYYPLEFITAVINNFGGFYRTWVYVEEARICGADLQLPYLNKSKHLTHIEGSTIYLGFIHVKSLEEKLVEQIITERDKNGIYLGLSDFIKRVRPSVTQLEILIRTGAFRFTGQTKKQLLWDMYLFMKGERKKPEGKSLFETTIKQFELPELQQDKLEDAYDELELFEFPVSLTRFQMLKTDFRGEVKAKDLLQMVGKKVKMVGNLVTYKFVPTSKGETMSFATFLDDENNFFDTVHFAQILARYPFQGAGVYLVLGKVTEEFGFPSLDVEKFARLEVKGDPRVK